MQIIWLAEAIRDRDPDLYEAALDSVKRQEFLEGKAEEERQADELIGRCHFTKSDGELCGSYALRNKTLCYFHSQTAEGRKKKKKKAFHMPVLEDDLAVQMVVTNVCRGLAEESLEPKRATTLLYGLQVATTALRRKTNRKASENRE